MALLLKMQMEINFGPAVELEDGTKEWYVNGTKLTEEGFNNRYSSCTSKIVEIDGKRYKLEEV